MADSIDSFNEETQRERVKAGMKGGPFFNMPSLTPTLHFVEGAEKEVTEKYQAGNIPNIPLESPWFNRRK